MPISAYSTTPASNTSISGINIGEGCPPSNINDAIRQMMADIAAGATLQQAPASTGSANAYAVTLTPAPAAYSAGMIVTFIANFTNTAAATVNVNALGAKSIFGMTAAGIAALSGNEIKTNQVVSLIYDGTQFQLVTDSAVTTAKIIDSAVTTAKITDSAVTPAKILYVPVATIKRQIFTSSGTYTPNTGMVYCIIEAWGGGGGSGGVGATTFSNSCGSGGGGAGGYSRHLATATDIGASKAVTIGASGAAGASGVSAGGSGGATTLGTTIVVANGGSGGSGCGPASTSTGGAGGTAGTGNILAIAGDPGQGGAGYGNVTIYPLSGRGGTTQVGAGGQGVINSFNSLGNSGNGYGSGASGTVSGGTGGPNAGVAGQPGLMIITEFCSQ